jgi:hypothetical protein
MRTRTQPRQPGGMSASTGEDASLPPGQVRGHPLMTWHFTRFRVRSAREQAVLAARAASLQPCWDASPPLRAAYLLALGDQEWLDVTVWDGQLCGETPGLAQVADRPAFFEQLDELLGEECAVVVAHDLPETRAAH